MIYEWKENFTMKSSEQMNIRGMIKGIYDVQKLRIASGQRILAQILNKLGLPPEIPEAEDATKEEKAERAKMKKNRELIISSFLEKMGIGTEDSPKKDDEESPKKGRKKQTDFFQIIIKDYKGIIDYLVKNKGSVDKAIKNAGVGIISDQSEYEMLKAYILLEQSEEFLLKPLKRAVENHPLWTNFLKDVKGCGILMAGVIISEFDISKARYVSSFWKYAGLDTVEKIDEDGNYTGEKEARSKKERHLVEVEYISRDGKREIKKSITYNPFLKTKLIGVLGTCFLRSGGYYSDIYRNYRTRLDNNPNHDGKTAKHKHMMAIRYMIKYFLQDVFVAWYLIEGKTPPRPYHEGKLDMSPHSTICPYLEPLLIKKAYHMYL